MDIAHNHYDPLNLVSKTGTLEESLQIKTRESEGMRYNPVYYYSKGDKQRIKGVSSIYLYDDPECDVLNDLMMLVGGLPGCVLNLTNRPEDVKFRQEAVRELAGNPELLSLCDKMLQTNVTRSSGDNQSIYLYQPEHHFSFANLSVHASPEKMKRLLDQFHRVGEMATSDSLQRCVEWVEEIKGDGLFQEQYKEKRKVSDSRIVAAYSERYGGIRYGALKPGVNFDDFVDVLEPKASLHLVVRRGRKGLEKVEERPVVNYKHAFEKDETEHILHHGRQRMDRLNQITAEMLGMPGYLALAQIQHLSAGAHMYKKMEKMGATPVFPEITDEASTIHAEGLLPLRMVLKTIQGSMLSKRNLEGMCSNDFHFSPEDNLVQIEGANARGKSEAWRSIHLLINMANAGFPIPARRVVYGPVSASHFIKCKGKENHGCSEV